MRCLLLGVAACVVLSGTGTHAAMAQPAPQSTPATDVPRIEGLWRVTFHFERYTTPYVFGADQSDRTYLWLFDPSCSEGGCVTKVNSGFSRTDITPTAMDYVVEYPPDVVDCRDLTTGDIFVPQGSQRTETLTIHVAKQESVGGQLRASELTGTDVDHFIALPPAQGTGACFGDIVFTISGTRVPGAGAGSGGAGRETAGTGNGSGSLTVDGPRLPGSLANVRGTGCPPGSTVVITVSDTVAAVVTAGADGGFGATVMLPEGPPGVVRITAACGGILLSVDVALIITSTVGGVASSTLTILCFFVLLGGAIVFRVTGGP